MKILILIALRNLIQAKRRTAFLGTALSLVTMLLVLLMALSQGITENVIRSATTLTTGHINVGGFYKSSSNDSSPIITKAATLKALVEDEVKGDVDYVVTRHRGWARLVSDEAALQSMLVGVNIAQEPQLLNVIKLATRAEVTPDDMKDKLTPTQAKALMGDASKLKQPKSVVIFASQAKRLRVRVGDRLTLRTRSFTGMVNTVDVSIVAIAKDIGLLSNFSIFVPTDVVLELYQLKPDTSGAVQIYLKDIDQTREVMARVRQRLEKEGYNMMEYQPTPFFTKFETVQGEDWIGQKLDVTAWDDEVTFLKWIVNSMDTVSFGLVAILIIIIAVGVMNTMWISVRKRTKEIGTVRAMGMQRSSVMWMFLFEALLLGFGASLMGAMMGALIAALVNVLTIPVPIDAMRAILLSDTFYLSTTPKHLFFAVVGLTGFTTLAGLWPAIRASRMQPVEAIHQTE